MCGNMSTPESNNMRDSVCLFRYSLKFEISGKTIYLALLIWQSFECLTRQERLFYPYKALSISFLRQYHKLKIVNSTLLGLSNQIYCFKTKRYSFTHYAWLLICWIKVISPPLTSRYLLYFSNIWSSIICKVQSTDVGIVWKHWDLHTETCAHCQYLIFRCAARQAFYFGF